MSKDDVAKAVLGQLPAALAETRRDFSLATPLTVSRIEGQDEAAAVQRELAESFGIGKPEFIAAAERAFVHGIIGDRSIEDFGKIQIDRMVDMQQWVDSIKSVQKDERMRLAIVAANNHYAGFGPGTVNIFRNMLGLSEANWKESKEEREKEQYPARDSNQTYAF